MRTFGITRHLGAQHTARLRVVRVALHLDSYAVFDSGQPGAGVRAVMRASAANYLHGCLQRFDSSRGNQVGGGDFVLHERIQYGWINSDAVTGCDSDPQSWFNTMYSPNTRVQDRVQPHSLSLFKVCLKFAIRAGSTRRFIQCQYCTVPKRLHLRAQQVVSPIAAMLFPSHIGSQHNWRCLKPQPFKSYQAMNGPLALLHAVSVQALQHPNQFT